MKIILIGAKGTIGRAVHELLKKNHQVIPVGFSEGEYQVDITQTASIKGLFEKIGKVDAVISTTGISAFGEIGKLTDEQFSLGWKNKLMGQINILRVGLPFLHNGGVVLLTSGMLAEEPTPGSSATSATNGALNSFVKAAAIDLKDTLRINTVSPIFVKETMEMMGMEAGNGMSASDTAKAYQAGIEGSMTGEVIDVRCYI